MVPRNSTPVTTVGTRAAASYRRFCLLPGNTFARGVCERKSGWTQVLNPRQT